MTDSSVAIGRGTSLPRPTTVSRPRLRRGGFSSAARIRPGSSTELTAPTTPWRLFLLLLPLAGGAGLVTYVVADISLPLATTLVGVVGAVAWLTATRTVSPEAKRWASRRLRQGALSGAAATICYDAARFGVASAAQFSFQPFHVIPIFGRLLLGKHTPDAAAVAMGLAFHLANGIGFGIAYALLVRRPTVVSGILWGLGLELIMAFLYPSWLRIMALREFLTVSAIGHVVYGAVLGFLLRRTTSENATHA